MIKNNEFSDCTVSGYIVRICNNVKIELWYSTFTTCLVKKTNEYKIKIVIYLNEIGQLYYSFNFCGLVKYDDNYVCFYELRW